MRFVVSCVWLCKSAFLFRVKSVCFNFVCRSFCLKICIHWLWTQAAHGDSDLRTVWTGAWHQLLLAHGKDGADPVRRQAQDWKAKVANKMQVANVNTGPSNNHWTPVHQACWHNKALGFAIYCKYKAIYGYVLMGWCWDVDVNIVPNGQNQKSNISKQQNQILTPPEHPLCALICLRGDDRATTATVDPMIIDDRCTSKPCHPWGHMAFRTPLHAEYIWIYIE